MNNYEYRFNLALKELHSKMFHCDGNMRPEFSEVINCPLCESELSKEYCVKDGFHHRKCLSCDMVYISPRLNKKATLEFYNSPVNEIYNEQKFHATDEGTSADDKINLQNLQLIARHLGGGGVTSRPLHGKKLLEIGCAKGYFLTAAREFGAEVFGVELNSVNAKIARRTHGANIYDEDLFELNLPAELFDIIYTRDVIEHIHNPRQFIDELSRLMAPGALIVIDTHNIDGLIHKLVRGRHTCLFGFEHPVHWSPKTLPFALKMSGLETKEIHFESLDLGVSTICQYFRQSTFTTIFPWKAPQPFNFMLRAVSVFFRRSGIWFIDKWLMLIAERFGAGSTMVVVGFKPEATTAKVS